MGKVQLNTQGYTNTGYEIKNALSGVKQPYLPMALQLLIKNAPPPLFLLMNPNSMSFSFVKRVNATRTRGNSLNKGYVFQHHFDELDIMTCNGVTAMAYSPKLGLTSKNLHQSASWDNWQKLLATFRNNGVNLNKYDSSIIDTVGRVAIYYDRIIYYGSFDTLSWQHSDQNPYNYTFSWNFTVSKKIDSNIYPTYMQVKR